MNKENLSIIKKTLLATAAYFGQTLTELQLTMYAEDLSDFPANEIAAAIKKIRVDPKQQRFPLPAKIRETISPAPDPETEAKEAAARIIGAIREFGWCNPEGARRYVGELAWSAITTMGSWEGLCENLQASQIPTYQAQFRELIKAKIHRKQGGYSELPPGENLSGFQKLEPGIKLISSIGRELK